MSLKNTKHLKAEKFKHCHQYLVQIYELVYPLILLYLVCYWAVLSDKEIG